jgi:hypothetical protein
MILFLFVGFRLIPRRNGAPGPSCMEKKLFSIALKLCSAVHIFGNKNFYHNSRTLFRGSVDFSSLPSLSA